MKPIFIIWGAIVFMAFALLFPPYGYTRISCFTAFKEIKSIPPTETSVDVPWTYLRHQFIFSIPPRTDPRLRDRFKSDEYVVRVANPENPAVSWTVVAVEIGIALLVAAGLLYTTRQQPATQKAQI